jgi:hypothetical protein
MKKQKKKPNPLCLCGCSQPVTIFRGRPRRFVFGHYSKTRKKPRPAQKYCACSCGAPTNYHRSRGYSTWLVGHFTRKKREIISCACGCGTKIISVSSYGRTRRYISGHSMEVNPPLTKGYTSQKNGKGI